MSKPLLMRNCLTIAVFLIFSFVNETSAQVSVIINGESDVCQGTERFYTTTGPFTDVVWQVFGNAYTTKVDSGVFVYWRTAGDGEVVAKATTLDGSYVSAKLDVTVNPLPRANIMDESGGVFLSTAVVDSNLLDSLVPKKVCSPACELMPLTYRSQFPENNDHAWSIEGGILVGNTSNPAIEAKWSANVETTLQLTITNDFGCTDTTKICIDVLQSVLPSFVANNSCVGGDIYFQNTSPISKSFLWDFGDGSTSELTHPIHAFASAGSYEVTLYSFNFANCMDSIKQTVEIHELVAPQINCTGPVCIGSTKLYETIDKCASYSWNVIGGIIQQGQGTSTIEVLWDQGLPFGTLELEVTDCEGNLCPEKAIVRIPILEPTVDIIGEIEPCTYSDYVYTVNPIPGTVYNWIIEGGQILANNGSHEILVEWGRNGIGKLSLDYENPTLGCSGIASIGVNIKNRPEIYAPYQLCEGELGNAGVYNSSDGNWDILGAQITSDLGNQIGFIASDFEKVQVEFVSSDPNLCKAKSIKYIDINKKPPTLDFIHGDTIVCHGKQYRYYASPFDLNKYSAEWVVTGGQKVHEASDYVDVIWNGNPKKLTVYLKSRKGKCEGDRIELGVKNHDEYTFNFTTTSTFCPTSILKASATMDGEQAVEIDGEYKWTITPSAAGVIVSGQYTKDITIRLDSEPGPFSINLEVIPCQNPIQNISKPYNIYDPELANINFTPFCEGESSLLTNDAASFKSWEINGNTTSNEVVTINEESFVVLNYEDSRGCPFSVFQIIDPNPIPKLGDNNEVLTFCQGTTINEELATVESNGFTYQWSKDGNEVAGETQSVISVNQPGSYLVEVTNEFNCSATKDFKLSYITCSPGGSCTSQGVSFTTTQNCNQVTFTNTSPNGTQNLILNFGDGNSHQFTTPGETVVHTYNENGLNLYAILSGDVPGLDENGNPSLCPRVKTERIQLSPVAVFSIPNNCDGLVMNFVNQSQWFKGNKPNSWNWYFGDPASGSNNTSNLENPSHQFSGPGTYTVSLEINNGTCSDIVSRQVEIIEGDNFTHDAPVCILTPFETVISEPVLNSSLYHEFYFNGVKIPNKNISTSYFKSSGSNTIELKTYGSYGCSNSVLKTINVAQPTVIADITVTGVNPFCDGDSILLEAAMGSEFVWSNKSTTQSVYAKNKGVYSIMFKDVQGCLRTPAPIIAEVLLGPEPKIYSRDAPGFCNNYNYMQVDPEKSGTYAWTVNGQDQMRNSPNLFSDKEGEFVIKVTDNSTSCSGISPPFIVEKHHVSALNISGLNAFCNDGSAVVLTASSIDEELVYTWQHNGSHNPVVSVAEPNMYLVTAENEFGCTITNTHTLYAVQSPDGEQVISGCFEACDEDKLVLRGLAGFRNQWFKEVNGNWVSQGFSETLTVNETGVFKAIVTNIDHGISCPDESAISVVKFEDCAELEEAPELEVDKNKICIGDEVNFSFDSDNSVVYLDFRMEGSSNWTVIDTVEAPGFLLKPEHTGDYRLRLYSNPNALFGNEIRVEVVNYPNTGVIVADKPHYCSGDTISLKLENYTGSLITWEEKEFGSASFTSLLLNNNPLEYILDDQAVDIRVKVENDICVSFDTILIKTPDTRPLIVNLNASLDALCSPDTVEINASYSGDFVSWQTSVGDNQFQMSGETSNTWIDVPLDSTRYVLSVKNGVCPVLTDTVKVKVFGEAFSPSFEPLVCETDKLIKIDFPYPNMNFQASIELPSGTIAEISLNETNNHSFDFSNTSGAYVLKLLEGTCYQELKDTILVLNVPDVDVLFVDSVSCFGLFDGEIEVSTILDPDFQPILNWTQLEDASFSSNSSLLTGLSAGTFKVEVGYKDLPPCIATESVLVKEPLELEIQIENLVDETCENYGNGELEFSIKGGTTPYQTEVTIDGFVIPSNQIEIIGGVLSVTGLVPGDGEIKVVDKNGCTSLLAFTIKAAPLFDFFIDVVVDPLCSNDNTGQVKVTTTGTIGNAQFEWSDGQVTSDSIRNDMIAGPGRVKIVTGLGCIDSLDFTLIDPPLLEVEIDSILNSCIGELGGYLSASAYGGTGNLNYAWSNGVIGKVNAGISPDYYTVTVTDENGCEKQLSDSVGGRSKPIVSLKYIGPDCGERFAILEVIANSEEISVKSDTSLGVFVDLILGKEIQVSVKDFGYHTIELEVNNDGCVNDFAEDILFRVKPEAKFDYKATRIDLGYNFSFDNLSSNADVYFWDFNGSAESFTGFNPDTISFQPDHSGDVYVCLEAGTSLGCFDKFCVDIRLDNVLSDVLIPSSFTPNDDGVNDMFIPIYSGIVPDMYSLQIWSRFSDIVFESNDPKEGWDGTFQNRDVSPGLYVFILQFRNVTSGEYYNKKGTILVTR